jgi:hypothetical protein
VEGNDRRRFYAVLHLGGIRSPLDPMRGGYRGGTSSAGGHFLSDCSERQNDPKFWRDRAEEVRTIADGMSDGTAKATLLDIAEKYDVLARLAAERAARMPKSS